MYKGEITYVCPPPLLSPFVKIQPIITLEGSVSHTFQRGGKNKVTVQVASGSAIVQDSRDVTVKGELGGGHLQSALIGATRHSALICNAVGAVLSRCLRDATSTSARRTPLMNKVSLWASGFRGGEGIKFISRCMLSNEKRQITVTPNKSTFLKKGKRTEVALAPNKNQLLCAAFRVLQVAAVVLLSGP